MIWFYGNPRFNSVTSLNREMRKEYWDDVENMNNDLIIMYNDIVKKNDTVFIIGDIFDHQHFHVKKMSELFQRLNGDKMIINNYYKNVKYNKLVPLTFKNFSFSYNDFLIDVIEDLTFYRHSDSYYTISAFDNNENDISEFCTIKNIYTGEFEIKQKNSYILNVDCECHSFKPVSLDTLLS